VNLPFVRKPLPQPVFALAVSAFWILCDNGRFWREILGLYGDAGVSGAVFIIALALLLCFLQALLLLLFPTARSMKWAGVVLTLVAATSAYFISALGAVIDLDMIRNVAQTDTAEARDLISVELLLRVFITGVVPAFLILKLPVAETTWRRRLIQRGVFAAGGIAICSVLVLASSASFADFLREHKVMRSMLSPGSAVWNTTTYVTVELGPEADSSLLPDPGGTPWKVAAPQDAGPRRPLLVVVVVGETARAADFQLGGYSRQTNPELAVRRDIFYFRDASACGTSTAISVPCMFSQAGRVEFKASKAARIPNLLDVLTAGGIEAAWFDNNSGCKKVCSRVPTLSFFGTESPGSRPTDCTGAHCFDDVLDKALGETIESRIRRDGGESLVVLHQIGSHGPAYSERYPADAGEFVPACTTSRLNQCPREEILNAYDNTILYTDHVLASHISRLEAASAHLDSVLIYLSDHGESLGENGIYLHGLPRGMAPAEQTRVPMLLWMSAGFRDTHRVDTGCLERATVLPVSHDNLFHTVMGTLGLRNNSYRAGLDLMSRCQGKSAPVS
jgi:lipid A ethanolaminephosphotransferase